MNRAIDLKTRLLMTVLAVLAVLNVLQWHKQVVLQERVTILQESRDLNNQHLALLYRYCSTVERIGSAYHKTLTFTLEGLGVRRGPAHELVYIQNQRAIGGFDGGTDITGP